MSDDLEHLTDEDYEAIGAIVERGAERVRGEQILAAVEASARAAEKPHPLVEAIARAYQARADKE